MTATAPKSDSPKVLSVQLSLYGRPHVYTPQSDVTALEAARLAELLVFCTNVITETAVREQFIEAHGLQRHFTTPPPVFDPDNAEIILTNAAGKEIGRVVGWAEEPKEG